MLVVFALKEKRTRPLRKKNRRIRKFILKEKIYIFFYIVDVFAAVYVISNFVCFPFEDISYFSSPAHRRCSLLSFSFFLSLSFFSSLCLFFVITLSLYIYILYDIRRPFTHSPAALWIYMRWRQKQSTFCCFVSTSSEQCTRLFLHIYGQCPRAFAFTCFSAIGR